MNIIAKNHDWGNTTGERIQWLRNSSGLTRRALREIIHKKYPDVPLGESTIQGWESGKQPRKQYVAMLCDVFGCTKEFLLCKSDEFINENNSDYTQITKENIHLYDGEPVFLKRHDAHGRIITHYALINSKDEYLVFSDRSIVYFDTLMDDTEIFIRNLFTGNVTLDPIPLELAKTLNSVYISETNDVAKSMYAGYYKYNSHTDCFEKDDQSVILRASAYGVSYVAYTKYPF